VNLATIRLQKRKKHQSKKSSELTMRPTGLDSGIDKDRPDYIVYCGEWDIGRIYQTRGGPDSLRWFWSLVRCQVATLEKAKAQFQKSWDGVKGVGEAGRKR
jgi:hypothetical protein